MNEITVSRKEFLEKATKLGKTAIFVIPTILTFKVSDLHAKASKNQVPGF